MKLFSSTQAVTLAVLGGLLTGYAAPAAFAAQGAMGQPGPAPDGAKHPRAAAMMHPDMELPSAQEMPFGQLDADAQQKARDLHQKFMKEAQPMVQDIRAKREALMAYLQSPTANKGEAKSRQQQLQQAESRFADRKLDYHFQLRDSLGKEQFAKLMSAKQERMEQRKQQWMQQQQQSAPRQQGATTPSSGAADDTPTTLPQQQSTPMPQPSVR